MSWLCIFTIYKIANLSEIWLAVFTGFSSLPFLLTTMQDTIEVGPLESHKLETSQLDIAKHGTLTKVNLILHYT